jgi:hypothetical protein
MAPTPPIWKGPLAIISPFNSPQVFLPESRHGSSHYQRKVSPILPAFYMKEEEQWLTKRWWDNFKGLVFTTFLLVNFLVASQMLCTCLTGA